MGKAKREAKRARRDAQGTRRAETYEAEARTAIRRDRRRRWFLSAVLPVTLAMAGALYWGAENQQAAGVVILLGALVFFLYGLGRVGGSVKPRSGGGPGSIDFGRRR